jgi:hypothetical protein
MASWFITLILLRSARRDRNGRLFDKLMWKRRG